MCHHNTFWNQHISRRNCLYWLWALGFKCFKLWALGFKCFKCFKWRSIWGLLGESTRWIHCELKKMMIQAHTWAHSKQSRAGHAAEVNVFMILVCSLCVLPWQLAGEPWRQIIFLGDLGVAVKSPPFSHPPRRWKAHSLEPSNLL